MTPEEAAEALGVDVDTPIDEVRRAYRAVIRHRHPDRAGEASTADAAHVIAAYATLRDLASGKTPRPTRSATKRPTVIRVRWRPPIEPASITRIDDDTIAIGAPANEAFLLLLEAAHDIGEVAYLDRSVPILEAICQFVGTPTISLVVTIQGRNDGTEAFCTTESIEARPGPPTKDVVDVYESFLRRRQAVTA